MPKLLFCYSITKATVVQVLYMITKSLIYVSGLKACACVMRTSNFLNFNPNPINLESNISKTGC